MCQRHQTAVSQNPTRANMSGSSQRPSQSYFGRMRGRRVNHHGLGRWRAYSGQSEIFHVRSATPLTRCVLSRMLVPILRGDEGKATFYLCRVEFLGRLSKIQNEKIACLKNRQRKLLTRSHFVSIMDGSRGVHINKHHSLGPAKQLSTATRAKLANVAFVLAWSNHA